MYLCERRWLMKVSQIECCMKLIAIVLICHRDMKCVRPCRERVRALRLSRAPLLPALAHIYVFFPRIATELPVSSSFWPVFGCRFDTQTYWDCHQIIMRTQVGTNDLIPLITFRASRLEFLFFNPPSGQSRAIIFNTGRFSDTPAKPASLN